MKQPLFTGVCTALVTPFLNNHVNYPLMEQLLLRQIHAGVPAVVVSGTTGEAPTLSDSEKIELFARCKSVAKDRCTVIAGTGSNNTAHSVQLSIAAQEAGADALLLVSPYYNKATPDGLFAHFLSIAHAVSIPVIVYNVPSRTGVDIPVGVYQRLSRVPNIAGVKEASTDVRKIASIRAACPDSFCVWSGNDDQIVPSMSLGAQGVISVVSNVLPTQTLALTQSALSGDYSTAANYQLMLSSLIEALFCEVNPIPVKAAMKMIGFDCGGCRLPLTQMENDNLKRLEGCLQQFDLNS